MKRLAILGSTGSIGQSTLSIVEQFPERCQVATLAAGRNIDEAFAQAVRWQPKVVSLATEEHASQLQARLRSAGVSGIEVVHGTAGTVACSTRAEVDFVVSAIVGVSGLEATHAAILAGDRDWSRQSRRPSRRKPSAGPSARVRASSHHPAREIWQAHTQP